MPLVKIHYTVEGDSAVIATISANVATIDFIKRGLPGQPEGYRPIRVEHTDGTELADGKAKPPDTVYVVGLRE